MGLSVQARDEMLWKAEQRVLSLAVSPTPTHEIVSHLRSERIDEYFARAAILFLLDRGRLRMTDDSRVFVSNGKNGAH
jgi:hypothetical protein